MNLPTIKLTQQLSRFDNALKQEWIITNGLGGYSSSTVLGVNTRKYHGLLVAALNPPGDRTVCVSKLDEEVQVDNKVYMLGANEFEESFFPKGFMHLQEFEVSPFPICTYRTENIEVQKTIFMPQRKNATITLYSVKNNTNSEVTLRVFPLLTCRHFHSVIDKATNPLNFTQHKISNQEVQLTFNQPNASVAVRATSGEFFEKPNWIEHLRYREEAIRGESNTDDCYQPGYYLLKVPKSTEEKFALIAVADESSQQTAQTMNTIGNTLADVDRLLKQEIMRCSALLADFYVSYSSISSSDWLNWVLLSADSFLVNNSNKIGVIAGYPWFETWGRDTFISLNGLMLVTGKFKEAKKLLSQFNVNCEAGLIPNFLADKSGQAAYNTVDATLWYVNAVLQYLKYTGDFEFIRSELWENIKCIIEKHLKGTRFGIHVDNDGLLAHGGQLTWMDAEIDGKAVTPRAGKAVEIQALWYNALRSAKFFAERFSESDLAETYNTLADKCRTSFTEKFWNSNKRCLFDVVGEGVADASLRPNQLFAVSLDFTMLDAKKNKSVVDVVQRELVTPYGLRTLERDDPNYKGTYSGNRKNRDVAYHNGTVWPWLLGPFMTAFHRTKGYTDENFELALTSFVWPLFTRHISQAGLGALSEIFDGDSPHTPNGCIAQAWSVAEPLRGYMEDALQIRPKYEKELRL